VVTFLVALFGPIADRDHETVVDVLAAFIRENAPEPHLPFGSVGSRYDREDELQPA
jgi:hypothetical protein